MILADFARRKSKTNALLVFRLDSLDRDSRVREVPKLARRISDLDTPTRTALVQILRDPSPELAEINVLAAETINGLGLTVRRALAEAVASGATGDALAQAVNSLLMESMPDAVTRTDAYGVERQRGYRVFDFRTGAPVASNRTDADGMVQRMDADSSGRAERIAAICESPGWGDFTGEGKSDEYVSALRRELTGEETDDNDNNEETETDDMSSNDRYDANDPEAKARRAMQVRVATRHQRPLGKPTETDVEWNARTDASETPEEERRRHARGEFRSPADMQRARGRWNGGGNGGGEAA